MEYVSLLISVLIMILGMMIYSFVKWTIKKLFALYKTKTDRRKTALVMLPFVRTLAEKSDVPDLEYRIVDVSGSPYGVYFKSVSLGLSTRVLDLDELANLMGRLIPSTGSVKDIVFDDRYSFFDSSLKFYNENSEYTGVYETHI
jgi:hypothetical protein